MEFRELSPHIIFEILTRVSSLKTLDTCKLVCKEWHDLIHHPSFMPTYCKRTNNLYGYILQHTGDKYYVSFDQFDIKACTKRLIPHDMTILASCSQGIIFGFYHPYSRFYLYKPTAQAKKWQVLPESKNGLETVVAALTILKSSSNNYLRCEIVRLSLRKICHRSMKVYYASETFDSKSWTWYEQEDIVLPHGEQIITTNQAVSTNNYTHLLTYHDNVLAFDRTSYSFHKFALPESVYKNHEIYKCKQLLEYQRKLGFTCQTHQGNIELWTLHEDHTKYWMKKMTINLVNIKTMPPSPILGFYNADIALIRGSRNEVVFYNVRDCSYNTLELDGLLLNATQCFQFRSDQESVHLFDPKVCRNADLVCLLFAGCLLFLVGFLSYSAFVA